MIHSMEALSGAFLDPPMGAQKAFRLALAAMSRPATIIEADARPLFGGRPPVSPLLAALLLTLIDGRTPVYLTPDLKKASEWLAFHAAAVIAEEPDEAAFVVSSTLSALPPLASLSQGLERYPDRSATVLAGSDLGSPGLAVWASGPGLKEPRLAGDLGLDDRFVGQWEDNHAAYPLGVDVFLASDKALAALPRSTKLSRKAP
ncbi:MAG: phosphonate C-P lyase system protein PhnH [Deltaproteobacteria bacterium]|jgi:alpha-D-ribose 1-methylphosphonate 5-triphosphate synthase subunit PhnH|nr:phosphonate C-P lyase system protein PhnH [Deltaproteobacteria bacterium]